MPHWEQYGAMSAIPSLVLAFHAIPSCKRQPMYTYRCFQQGFAEFRTDSYQRLDSMIAAQIDSVTGIAVGKECRGQKLDQSD